MSRGVLDTSTFIWLGRIAKPEASLPSESVITSVTLAELSVGSLVADDPTVRADRQQQLLQAQQMEILPFDTASAHAFGSVAAELRALGSKGRARAFDALIAATAIANDLPLYTGNPSGFCGISRLQVRPISAPATGPS